MIYEITIMILKQFFYSFAESFHSMPSSYQLLTPSKEYSNDIFMNGVRDRPFSPLLRSFSGQPSWPQSPNSDSSLPRLRRDASKELQESPTSSSNKTSSNLSNESNTLQVTA